MLTTSTFFYFFFNDTATTEIYTLSLHDALPIWVPFSSSAEAADRPMAKATRAASELRIMGSLVWLRSEEHTSELQSHVNLVCRLLLEKKNKSYVSIWFVKMYCAMLVWSRVRLCC